MPLWRGNYLKNVLEVKNGTRGENVCNKIKFRAGFLNAAERNQRKSIWKMKPGMKLIKELSKLRWNLLI